MFSRTFKLTLAIFITLLAFTFATSTVSAATYYVDSAGGNDSNSGTSESQPWKNLSKLHNMNFQPGDVISFKRGSTWDGPLVINDSGNSN